jgi:dTDP-glucose 4,6-dehydratase
MKYQKILVTGSEGFIGSHLTQALIRAGHTVRAFVLYNSFGSNGWLDTIPADIKSKIEFLHGDIRDPHFVQHAVDGMDAVLHLAALIAIPYSYHAPESYVQTNVIGTLNIVQAARAAGTKKIVSTSTSEVYGTAQFVPITEDHPLVGQSPYSASKIGADQMALSFQKSFGTPVAIARPFNTYGPRQSVRAVIPTIITQLAQGQGTLELGALTPTRDFNFVEDVVAGLIAVMNSDDAVGQVINIGSAYEISIGDTAAMIAQIMNKTPKIVCKNERLRPANSEVERLFASNDRAQKILNWHPAHGGVEGLRKGLEKTIQWFTDPKNLAYYQRQGFVL